MGLARECRYMDWERYTCNRPLSSRSPRSFTKTTSSRRRRTRSRGSAMEVLVSSSGEAIVLRCDVKKVRRCYDE